MEALQMLLLTFGQEIQLLNHKVDCLN